MAILKNILKQGFKIPVFFASFFDKHYLVDNVPMAKEVSHSQWRNYLYENFNKPGLRILEVGSREVTGESEDRKAFSNATYVGFDFYDGDNVDVVGDAHKLSSYFKEEEKFDLIYSSACFEHFAMPWVVATEIGKLLKVGGTVFVETHFAFSSHERPWHFFHYTDMAMRTLFPPANGFECLEVGFSNPVVGRFSSLADKYLKNRPMAGLYCHIEFLGKKVKEVENFSWNTVDLQEVVGDTKYPEPKD